MAQSGSVTLLEAAKPYYSSDLLTKGVVDTIIRESPILETLPMMPIQGNALMHTQEDTLPTVSFRQVNATYSRDFGTDVSYFWGTAILGGEVFIDNYIVNTRGNRHDVKARQFAKKAKAAALTFDKSFFRGTGTADDFKGVNTLITEGFGQTVACASSSALALDDLDIAHDALRTGTADAILLNRTSRRLISKLARTSITGVSLIDVGTDNFGRQVMSWNDVPLRIVGDDVAGAAILSQIENQGGTAYTGGTYASLYMVRYGADELVSGLMGANGHFEVVDFGETQAAPGTLGRIEFYPGIAVFNKYAIVRLTGVK